MKHWIAYSLTPSDLDTEGVTISDVDLLNTYFSPYKAAVDADLLTGMYSYISVNGVPVIENTKLMTTLLGDDLKFHGLMVSDFGEINHLVSFHRTTRSTDETTKFSLERASVDMSMVGSGLSFTNGTNKLIDEKPEVIDRLKESPYEEKTGDLDDLTLPAGQIEYVKELASIETKAVADIIYGDVNPSGRLPITYVKETGNIVIPYRHRVSTKCATGNYCEPQWIFGHGLSYTNFTYSNLTQYGKRDVQFRLSECITNAGNSAGMETVMLFLTQPYRSIAVPEVKQLKKFSKISLEIGQGLKMVAEDADYVVAIKPETDCDENNETATLNPLCATFTISTLKMVAEDADYVWLSSPRRNETATLNPLCATFTISTGEHPFGSLIAE
ncbi:Glycoside hydrolase [Phytophthora megakarya]|uniref:beta-glucosidase n=1 Tax=Phytophthora megakarya TaxID=4795 RepID=A0A225X480_9STRA|nr:Glycoside hydrolase [Phytophthora megakarya]